MKWIKRNWLAILLYLAFGINIFFIQPVQQHFYLDGELQRIHRVSWHISLIVAAILFVLLLIYLLVKHITRISSWGAGLVSFLFTLIAAAFFFEPAVETTILFSNRKFPKGEYRHRYIVDSLAGDTAHQDLFLSDLEAKKPVLFERDKLLSAEKFDRLHFRDTVYVTFFHGLFGIDYPGNSHSN